MFGYYRQRNRNFFEEMERISNEMNRLFSDRSECYGDSCNVFPPVNIYEDAEQFFVRAEVPGMSKDQFEILATEKSVQIKGERKETSLGEEGSVHRRERDYGAFDRTLTLPSPIDSQKVMASYKDGILEVRLSKSKQSLPRTIKIEG